MVATRTTRMGIFVRVSFGLTNIAIDPPNCPAKRNPSPINRNGEGNTSKTLAREGGASYLGRENKSRAGRGVKN